MVCMDLQSVPCKKHSDDHDASAFVGFSVKQLKSAQHNRGEGGHVSVFVCSTVLAGVCLVTPSYVSTHIDTSV